MTVNINNTTTIQSQMDIHMGVSPAIEASSRQIDNIAWRMNVVAKTADYDVKVNDSGTMFTTVGNAADIEFTLPTPIDGLIYWFYNATEFELLLTPHANNKMVCFNKPAADDIAFTQANEQIGSCFVCFTDGTMWYVALMLGHHTATIAITDA